MSDSPSNTNTTILTTPIVATTELSQSATTTNILCNDPNGLCLVAKGCMDPQTSGVYTSLLRLAAQLNVEDTCQRIILETKSAIIHVKEFEGHAIVTKEMITHQHPE
jgi:hypothetical protein